MRSAHVLTMVIWMALAVAPSWAQISGHQMPAQHGAAAGPSAELVTACVDAQQQVASLAGQINGRLEAARQTNSPQEMRAALADLQAALVEIRTRAAQCSPLTAAAQPAIPMPATDHSKMTAGGAATPPKPADPMAGMDHAKKAMAGTAATPKPGAKRAPKPADPMAGMNHSNMPKSGAPPKPANDPGAVAKGEGKLPVMMAQRVADPACPDNVGRADAPRATYQRKVYYFCSTADRDAFKKDPAGYLKRRPR